MRTTTMLDEVKENGQMLALWGKYSRKNHYAGEISLEECCETARKIMLKVAGR